MSHFIMICRSSFSSGTPNGQAITQFPQAMQRGFRADWTTPSAVRLIASAGQTSAQVGWSQCMHTTGTVCVLSDRFTYSTWIIESPRWVSHSVQAWTHDWQPMQRLGSMKNWRWPGFIARSLLWLEHLLVGRRPVGAAEAHRADLVLGDLADRVLRRDGQLVGALRSGPVVGDEDGVRADGGHHLRLEGHRAAARLCRRPVAIGDAQLLGEPGVQLDARRGVLLHQRADAPGLRAGEELAHHAAGGEDQRVLGVDVLGGRTVLGDVEPRLSVREV